MKVICISESGSGGFVEKGNIYTVYSMFLSKYGITILLSEDKYMPVDHSINSFKIISHVLPPNWFFKYFDEEKREQRKDCVEAIWGYKEMVFCLDHYHNLVGREHEATEIFGKRKEEFDYFEEFIVPNENSKIIETYSKDQPCIR